MKHFISLMLGLTVEMTLSSPTLGQHLFPSRSYVLFFEPNRTDLTARAMQILSQVVSAAAQIPIDRIEIYGNCDTAEPQPSRLSLERAQKVAQQLTSLGMPPKPVVIKGLGTTHLLVPTGRGIPEPQNRYAEVILRKID